MIGAIIFLFFISIIFYFIIAFDYGKKKNRFLEFNNFMKLLARNGYQILDNISKRRIENYNELKFMNLLFSSSPQFKARKRSIEFRFSVFRKGSNNAHYYLRINCTMPINPKFFLKIRKRGFISKLLGINKGEYYGLNENYSIECNNLMIIKFLLNQKKYLAILKKVVDGSSETLTFNRRKTSLVLNFGNFHTFFLMTNNLLSLVEAINNISDEYKINSEKDLSTGFEIDEDLKLLTLSELEFLTPTCVICYQTLIEDIKKFKSDAAIHAGDSRILDKVVYLLCCSSFAHDYHLLQWIKTKNICPYCKYKSPEMDPVYVNIIKKVEL